MLTARYSLINTEAAEESAYNNSKQIPLISPFYLIAVPLYMVSHKGHFSSTEMAMQKRE